MEPIEKDIEKLQGLAIKVDKILRQELKNEKIKYSFAEARMYNIRTLGVQGDDSSYKYATEITVKDPRKRGRRYEQQEFDNFLANLASRITNEISEINRVVYTAGENNKSNFFP